MTDEEIELVIAKSLYGRNYYPGRKIPDVLWPPRTASQTAHYMKLAKAVADGLRTEGYMLFKGLETGSRC